MKQLFNKLLRRKQVQTDKVRDPKRLDEIARLRLHEEGVDEILNNITQKAAEEFDLPIGLVSIVMDESQYFAGSHGLEGWIQEVNGTPVEWSFCANSVKSEKPFIVEDSTTNDIVKDNPLVTQEGIRCYAGVPLVSSNNIIVGNFCVIGDKTRSFGQDEIERLHEYSKEAMKRIETRVAATA